MKYRLMEWTQRAYPSNSLAQKWSLFFFFFLFFTANLFYCFVCMISPIIGVLKEHCSSTCTVLCFHPHPRFSVCVCFLTSFSFLSIAFIGLLQRRHLLLFILISFFPPFPLLRLARLLKIWFPSYFKMRLFKWRRG